MILRTLAFIETLHRRGYRFIAPVDGTGAPVVERSEQVSPVAATHAESKNLARWQKWAAIVVLVVGATLLGLWVRSPLPPPRVLASQELTNDGLPKGSLVTDGNRVYFTETLFDHYTISQVSSRGGETAAVDVPLPNPLVRGISTEQSELLVQLADGSFWSMPVPAGAPRRLGDVIRAVCCLGTEWKARVRQRKRSIHRGA